MSQHGRIVKTRVIKAYWDCEYCGTTKIDGLVDNCPNCGKQKSSNVECYRSGAPIEVTDEELKAARIKREECDGNHKDWVCAYCNQLNNYSDDKCVACGGPKSEATHEYGGTKIRKTDDVLHYTETPIANDSRAQQTYEETVPDSPVPYIDDTPSRPSFSITDKLPQILTICGVTALIGLFIWLMVWLFAPLEKEVTVNGFSWKRQITIEEERTVKEDDWYVPAGGRVYETRQEVRDYQPVIDHYETITETKTREVFDHNETTYTYQDNGNGTYTEIEIETPVYRTEYYTESHDEPVYRQEPIYDTRYYYEIERWFDVDEYDSMGQDKEPYWNEAYTLAADQRDTNRSQAYYVHYSDDSTEHVSYDEWLGIDIGDGYLITYNRLGFTYSKTATN